MSKNRIVDITKYVKRSPPPLLWHYTTLEGLQGIVKEQAIWATDVRYLNDRREYVHARDLFVEVITEKKKNASDSEKLTLDQSLDVIQTVHTLENYRVFVSSFSANEDQLSQWRAYGSAAKGISIGFDLRRLNIPEVESSANVFAPCVYSRQQQINMIGVWLQHFFSVMQRMKDANAKNSSESLCKDDPPDVATKKLLTAFGADLSMELFQIVMDPGRLFALMKHESFAEENEWRLVISESRARINSSPHKLQTRVRGTTFVPYISVPIQQLPSKHGSNSRIKSITIGPHPDPEMAMYALSEFLLSQDVNLHFLFDSSL
jgi:hypothetical protein